MDDVHGKHRGVVTNDRDPRGLGRVQVHVPDVLGDAHVWAMPSAPCVGPGAGVLLVPPVGAGVWVEFEGGDTDLPVWSGRYWMTGEPPVAVFTVEPATSGACDVTRLTLLSGGVTIVCGGVVITVTAAGVSVHCGASGAP